MNGRMSLVEQKRLQWAKEREEMARLSSSLWGNKPTDCNVVHQTIRSRMSGLTGAPVMKHGVGSDRATSPKNFARVAGQSHLLRASLVSLHDATGVEDRGRNAPILRQRSPSLPPIYTRESGASFQQLYKHTEVDQVRSRYQIPDQTRLNHRKNHHLQNHIRSSHYGSARDELEGETSGYASDSAEVPLPAVVDVLPTSVSMKSPETAMSENSLQNPKNYNSYPTPESSLPPSRRLSAVRGCAEVRPRWGGLWGQEIARGDPPPPSWLERGLSRMDHTSQVLVINHESASSPDSSTTGSAGSDSTKTYLRGQNVPLDEGILQEREAKRQKALELQNAIKHQLEERDRRRKEEKEQRLNEERAEEERIKRERDEEKQRFEEEQRRFKEKEDAKHKKEEAMRQVLEAAERLAQEEKRFRRKRNEASNLDNVEISADADPLSFAPPTQPETFRSRTSEQDYDDNLELHNAGHCFRQEGERNGDHPPENDPGKKLGTRSDATESKFNTIQLPVSTEVAIVLSGRLRDPEVFNASNLQVNLVVTPTPTKSEIVSNLFNTGEVFLPNLVSPTTTSKAGRNRFSEATGARLLTPSKYRMSIGREFGTQTDLEDLQENSFSYKEMSTKERKESLNANRRDIDKSANVALAEELSTKTLSRSKAQLRSSLEARPRWNANRPGTRYRTQSEKDPHYQRRLRLRRCQPDSSDEGSRSPSPGRRKPNNLKSKSRNTTRRKIKLDSYDADLSMDSLNSIVPLRVDKSGRINVENNKDEMKSKSRSTDAINNEDKIISINKEGNKKMESWCGREILSQLTTLRNGLAMKQKEWDPQRCLLSPSAEFY